MKIGIIGCGKIGSAISRHWVEAGHEVILSARHRDNAERLAERLGKGSSVATPEEAARLGEIVLLTIPLGEVPRLSPKLREALKGKIVMDTCNPYPSRDGKVAKDVIDSGQGTGLWTAGQLPGARIVRAFNSVHSNVFESEAHRKKDRIGVPLASDDAQALETVFGLVRDAGFAPVIVGGLREARRFDVGSPTYGSDLPEKLLRRELAKSGSLAGDDETRRSAGILLKSAQVGGAAFLASRALRPYLERRALESYRGQFAVVTGASSGIGYELARELGQAGCELLIVSHSPRIEEAAKTLRDLGITVETAQADLASYQGVEKFYERIRAQGRPVDVLALNAGVGYGGDFIRDNELKGVLHLIELNITSTVHLAKRVLEDMVARGQGRVLFTSSIAAFMAGSFEAVYSASKAFIESFAQGIRNELKDTGVTITTLLPGPTETDFFHRAQMEDTRIGAGHKDDPARVARQGIVALAQGRSHVIAGSFRNQLMAGMAKFLPQPMTAQLHRAMSRPGTAGAGRARSA